MMGHKRNLLADLLIYARRWWADQADRAAAAAGPAADADRLVARYRALIEHIPAGVVVHGRRSEILLANEVACNLLGLSREQLQGLEATDPRWHFLAADGTPQLLDDYPVSRVLRNQQPIKDLVVGIERADRDSPVWVICNAFTVLDDDGQLIEVVVSFTDVSDIKLAEQAMQKSEERLRLVLQGSRDAPWDWDLIQGTVYYSPRWWQMIGYAEDELATDVDLLKRMMHPADRAAALQSLSEAIASDQSSYEIEFRLVHKDGHDVPLLSRGFILRDQDGRALRVSGTNTDLTERKQAEQQIHQLAFYDPLTGLPNRRLLMEQLRKALQSSARHQQQGALLFIDLDNFKVLNDTLGHAMGDLLLRQVAERLRASVRQADTVARLGGDEFVVMLEDLNPRPTQAALEAELVAKKIIASLGVPYLLQGNEHRSTPSIGVALFNDRSQGVDGLLKQADLAMYQAKAMGRNTMRFFDGSMQTAVDQRMSMENDLREALQRGDFLLHYQRQVDDSGAVIGAEVLARWQHPERGAISPAAFIPLAESTGLILPLGRWVLTSACQRLARWAAEPRLSALTLSVNVSVQQFHESDFVAEVRAVLAATGANPARLKLELTESLLAENIDDIIAKMSALKQLGVGFALDDFGTGYSSLGYLQRMPLDQLKIDQSFVRDVLTNSNDAVIARIIITLAETLGLTVIAEGVEEEGQRQFLRANGCRAYQGYLFGRPLPAEDFEASLLTPRRRRQVAASESP